MHRGQRNPSSISAMSSQPTLAKEMSVLTNYFILLEITNQADKRQSSRKSNTWWKRCRKTRINREKRQRKSKSKISINKVDYIVYIKYISYIGKIMTDQTFNSSYLQYFTTSKYTLDKKVQSRRNIWRGRKKYTLLFCACKITKMHNTAAAKKV